jgi:hypothetical protein
VEDVVVEVGLDFHQRLVGFEVEVELAVRRNCVEC